MRRLETELKELDKGEGWGVWQGTEVGRAAADWSNACRPIRQRPRLRSPAQPVGQPRSEGVIGRSTTPHCAGSRAPDRPSDPVFGVRLSDPLRCAR